MAKEFKYRGHTMEELKSMPLGDFANLVKARERRALKKGFDKSKKKLIENIRKSRKPTKTHDRDLVIIPEMVGSTVMLYSGKEFVRIELQPEMIGHRLGEFVLTRRRVKHSAPGMGATRSSKFISLK